MVDGVTKQYEITSAFDVIEDVIISNISDPLTGQEARSSTDLWILDRYPKASEIGCKYKYPYIVIEYSEPEIENISCNGSIQRMEHTVAIRCFARTRLQANQLAQQINYIFFVTARTEFIKAALRGPFMAMPLSDQNWIAGNDVYMRGFEFIFQRVD
jgi:hypothetical protein